MIIIQYLYIPVIFYSVLGLLFILILSAIRASSREKRTLSLPVHTSADAEPSVIHEPAGLSSPRKEADEKPAAPCVLENHVEEAKTPMEKKEQRAQLKTILQKLHRRHQEKRLGDILIGKRYIIKQQLDQALQLQQTERTETLLGEILLDLGYVTEEQIMTAVMIQYHLHYIPLDSYIIKREILDVIPSSMAWKYLVIPIEKVMKSLTVAMFNPLNKNALKEIESASKCHVVPCLAKPSDLKRLVKEHYSRE